MAEKFQAMVYLRTLNSRMKDFYDVWLLASQFAFDGALLTKADRFPKQAPQYRVPGEALSPCPWSVETAV